VAQKYEERTAPHRYPSKLFWKTDKEIVQLKYPLISMEKAGINVQDFEFYLFLKIKDCFVV